MSLHSVITGTGSYIPRNKIGNVDFLTHEFYEVDGTRIEKPGSEIIEKFQEITTIAERRYVDDGLVASDIAFYAAQKAIESSGIDEEELDYIVVAHNFGDIRKDNKRSDFVPSLAARVKHKLKIESPDAVAYDLPFGCPGWLQAVIQADYFIKSGDAKKVLVIGAETLSRVCDPHDRDSMLYSDGAGAVILEAREGEGSRGIIAHKTRSDTLTHAQMLFMGESYNPGNENPDELYLKMFGRKLYQYALEKVPQAVKDCLDKSGVHLTEVKKVLIHQANGKMDDAILKRLFSLYDLPDMPDNIMPMTISWLGNSSVASIPTLLDLIIKGKMDGHSINEGDIVVFASVGAGMNINAMVYKA